MKNNKNIVTTLDFKKDFSIIISIFRQVFDNDDVEKFLHASKSRLAHQRLLDNTRVFGIKNASEESIGFSHYTLIRPRAELNWIGVLPNEQGSIQQYGTKLLNGSIELLQEDDISLITTASHKGSRGFYLKKGFEYVQDQETESYGFYTFKKEI